MGNDQTSAGGNERAEVLLAKILTAAAWADGRIDPDEREAVLHCVRHLKLTDEETRAVSSLLDEPLPRSAADEFTATFLAATESDDALRQGLLSRVRAILGEKDSLTDAESEFLGLVADAIERDRDAESFVGRIKSLFTWGSLRPTETRQSDVAKRLRDRLHTPRGESDIDPTRRDTATLYGALLQMVALADGEATEEEVHHISDFLRRVFAYDDEDVDLIIEAIGIELNAEIEMFRLTAEFNRVTDQAARLELVEAMFSLSTADGKVTVDEVETIRRAADHLWISRRDFNDLRVRYVVPTRG